MIKFYSLMAKTLYSFSIIAFFSYALTIPAFADVYRWVDSKGRVQFSDQPPPDSAAQRVTTKPATGSGSSNGVRTFQEKDQEFRKRQVEQQEAAKKKTESDEQASAKQKNCATAKAQLAAYERGGRFSRPNQKGETEIMDDKGLEAAKADTRKSVAEWCK